MKTGRVPFPMWLFLLLLSLAACDDGVKAVDSCGDGFLDPGEQCDGADLGGADCTAGDYYTGTLRCRADCTYDFSACTGRCGDNQLDPSETCEGGELRDQTCESLGFQSGQLACTAACAYDTSQCVGVCGDGLKDLNEGCDDGGNEAGDGCSPGCTVEAGWNCTGNPSWCTPVCGDGLLAGDEPCDGDDLDGATCESRGFYGGTLACASDCASFDESGCQGSCGDGVVQAEEGEVCDGDNLNGQTCLGLGMSGDGLACDSDCRLDTSACVVWTEVSAGAHFACAIDSAGDVWCWGDNEWGQCAQTGGGRFTIPVQVPNLPHPAVAISAGEHHACVILEEPGTQVRSLRCWGNNMYGQLGRTIAPPHARPTPEDVPGMESDVQMVSAGSDFTCAVLQGNLWCWGGNENCQLGRDGTQGGAFPTPVQANLMDATLTDLSCGNQFCVARTYDGVILTWGSHNNGKLGVNLSGPVCVPSPPTFFPLTFLHPYAGAEHACAVDNQNHLFCWGDNLYGQLGDGTETDQTTPVMITSTSMLFTAMNLGSQHSCAIDHAGGVWCWGSNNYGQNGTGDSLTIAGRNTPAEITTFTRIVVRIAAGFAFNCASLESGALYCWGDNASGQLGTGDLVSRDVPTPVAIP